MASFSLVEDQVAWILETCPGLTLSGNPIGVSQVQCRPNMKGVCGTSSHEIEQRKSWKCCLGTVATAAHYNVLNLCPSRRVVNKTRVSSFSSPYYDLSGRNILGVNSKCINVYSILCHYTEGVALTSVSLSPGCFERLGTVNAG